MDPLRAAWGEYRSRLRALDSIVECPQPWPSDLPGPGYEGTRCQLLEGHTQRDGTQHRHRVMGTQVIVEWD